MVREFKFRGYNQDQLKSISIEALLPLLNARQRRSLNKRVGKYMNGQKRKLREEIKLALKGNLNNKLKTIPAQPTVNNPVDSTLSEFGL